MAGSKYFVTKSVKARKSARRLGCLINPAFFAKRIKFKCDKSMQNECSTIGEICWVDKANPAYVLVSLDR